MSDRIRFRLAAAFLGLSCAAAPATHASDVCASAPGYRTDDPGLASLLERTLPVLDRFSSLDEAFRSVAPDICLFTETSEALGYFEPDTGRIAIDARLGPDLQAAILVHELRHVEQFSRSLCPDLSLSMQNYARAIWAMEADATTVSLIVVWDMAGRGDAGPLEALAAHPNYHDITEVFATAMTNMQDVAEASAAAFAAWYESETRRESYYLSSCAAYLDQQDATHALPQYGLLEPSFFLSLCRLPNGGRFECGEPPGAMD